MFNESEDRKRISYESCSEQTEIVCDKQIQENQFEEILLDHFEINSSFGQGKLISGITKNNCFDKKSFKLETQKSSMDGSLLKF